MLKVQITLHPFEIESTLDRLQYWAANFDWQDKSADITVELNVIPDYHGNAQKFDGDRFEMPHASPEQIAEMTEEYMAQRKSETLLERLKRNNVVKELSPDAEESLELMNFLRGGDHNG